VPTLDGGTAATARANSCREAGKDYGQRPGEPVSEFRMRPSCRGPPARGRLSPRPPATRQQWASARLEMRRACPRGVGGLYRPPASAAEKESRPYALLMN